MQSADADTKNDGKKHGSVQTQHKMVLDKTLWQLLTQKHIL